MLKKLLRYDLKSVFKYWWIAALTSFVLSFAGGGCIATLAAEEPIPSYMTVLIIFTLIFTFLALAAFFLISCILVYLRFYKNFFTDEGYLTFTLPVKRSQLLNSKLITSVLTMFCTTFVMIIDILVMVIIAVATTEGDSSSVYPPVEINPYIFLYIIEFIIIFLLTCILSTLFVFCCITFAALITKKAKVITAIGIYYVANGFISGIVQILYLFGISAVVEWLRALPKNLYDPTLAIILFGIILFLVLINILFYTLEYFMLDRKLNLA